MQCVTFLSAKYHVKIPQRQGYLSSHFDTHKHRHFIQTSTRHLALLRQRLQRNWPNQLATS